MTLKEDRFTMSADRYLAKNYVIVYLEDAISQLLAHREENPKVEPLKYLSQYFSSLRDGNHTMFREFSFIKSTSHSRASFVRLFWKCFRQIGKKGDLLSIQEYHSLLGLLCTDFPFKLVQKTARIVLIDDALDCLISFTDFIYAFQVQFFYEEFLDKCSELYQTLQQSSQSPRDPVIVPTSNDQDAGGAHQSNHLPVDGVDSIAFFRSVYPVCDRVNYSTPPVAALKEILFSTPRISFYGFLMAIAKSEAINEHIGRLPPKMELLEGADIELTSKSFPHGCHSSCQEHVVGRRQGQ
ncbi:centriolar satellite-associated tubulin polyglutamylase complex regulator 1-like isoform X2 [Littorina saxatilis]|uniref:centriolar satellite-associated tubulin polyglutamylase complex regulator 1-like isoform X2 n=1 Tax=Littorina saxatilis TaxID=31220 RepID=UPI0038B5CBB5